MTISDIHNHEVLCDNRTFYNLDELQVPALQQARQLSITATPVINHAHIATASISTLWDAYIIINVLFVKQVFILDFLMQCGVEKKGLHGPIPASFIEDKEEERKTKGESTIMSAAKELGPWKGGRVIWGMMTHKMIHQELTHIYRIVIRQ